MTHTVRVKIFKIGDVEDPDFYVTNFLLPEWFETPIGKFVKDNAIELMKYYEFNTDAYHNYVCITATFKDEKTLLEYHLKFNKTQDNS